MSRQRRTSLRENEKELGKLRGPHGYRLCRFCGTEVQPPRKTFCSDLCVHNWKLRSNVKYLRSIIYQRDLGICALCNVDTRYVRIELENAARASMIDSGTWSWTDNPIYLEICRKWKLTVKEAAKSLWQADHIIPVCEGGGECGIEGYRSLCISCHKSISEKSRRKRRNSL